MAAAASKLSRKAERHLEKGERCEAEALYADILVKFPKNRMAFLGREKSQKAPTPKLCDPPKEMVDEVITSHRQGEFEKVLTRVKPLLQVFPSALVLFHLQRASSVSLGRYEAGIDSYQKALKINLDHADAHFNMGTALKDMGEFDAAIDSFRQTLKAQLDYAGTYYNMGYI